MSKCVFCDIISGAAPTEFLYEDEEMVIIRDIKPAAKHHLLAIPKIHIKDVKSLTEDHRSLVEKLVDVGKQVLRDIGCDLEDVRVGFHMPPFNSVAHLHLHFITPTSDMSLLSRGIFKPNTWWFATADYVLGSLKSSL